MKIGEAVAATGMQALNGYEPVVVVLRDGRFRNFPLSEIAQQELRDEVFLTSGLFARDTIDEFSGRSKENVRNLFWYPFDFDLADFTGIEKARIRTWPQTMIWDTVQALISEVKLIFNSLGLPYHRIDYTGYGVAVYTYAPEHTVEEAPRLMDMHGRIVDRINMIAGDPICDKSVRDAGSRFTRLPPSPNRKGPVERISETLEFIPRDDAPITMEELELIAGAAPVVSATTPIRSQELAQEDMATLVEAIAPFWTEGRRHLIALGLCGLLAKSGVSEDQAQEVIAILSSDDPETRDRFACVRTTYNRFRAGGDLLGFYGLKDLLPSVTLFTVEESLERVKNAAYPLLELGERTSMTCVTVNNRLYEFAFDPIPEICLRGWVGQYVENMLPTTEAPAAFHWAAAMGLASATFGRHVAIEYRGPLFANLYLLLVGPSGKSRKDTAISNARNMLLREVHDGYAFIAPEPAVRGDVQSAEGIIDILAGQVEEGHPANLFLYLSEYSKLTGNAMRAGTSTIMPVLMELFDCPPFIGTSGRGKPTRAENPYVTIMAATQPAILASLVRPDDMTSGFSNRWFYVLGNGNGPKPRPQRVDHVWLNAAHRRLIETVESYSRRDGSLPVLTMSASCADRWDAWYIDHYNALDSSEEEAEMRQRHPVFAQKLSLIYAVLDGATEVQSCHLEAALAAVEWMWGHLRPLIRTWGRSDDGQIEERVLHVLHEHGAMKRRDLQAYCHNRRWSAVDFNRVLAGLLGSEVVVQGQDSVIGLPRYS